MGSIKAILFFLSVFCFGKSLAQVNRYMVFFTDKAGTPYSVDNPEEFLSPRAIQRRQNQNISISEEDIPVVSAYVESVQSAGAAVLYKSRWMNAVLVECGSSLVSSLEALPFVMHVEYVAPGGRPNPAGRTRSPKSKNSTSGTSRTTNTQLSMMGMDYMQTAGYSGEGILIAVFDSGFQGANLSQPFQHIFDESRFDALTSYNFVHGGHDIFNHDNHGTHVWSVIAANNNESYQGGAYKADFILFITEDDDTEYRVEEYNWLFAAERADSAGVDVINTSLGYNTFDDPQMDYLKAHMDGETAVITRAAEITASKGIAVVVSAGNEGSNSWGIITAPADGKNVLAVGAVNSSGMKVSNSSFGPAADGRIKPDVAALGLSVAVINANGSIGSSSGTSVATPFITSLVAGVWQMLPDLTARQVMDTVLSTASQAMQPDNLLGYGIPNFLSILKITSAEEKKPDKLVDIYPNPVSREFIVRPVNPDLTDQLLLEIYDMRGSKINFTVRKTEHDEVIVDLDNRSPGLYLLRVQANNRFSVHKLLKVE